MNLTTTVMMSLVLFVLSSGLLKLTLALNRLRHFSLESRMSWNEALRECKQKNTSIVTLYDEGDANFTFEFVNSSTKSVWLGLHRSRANVSTWSNGVPYKFNMSDVNQANGQQICEAIENNTWKGFSCSERKHFMCYKGNNYFLIDNEKKNWCQALQHCRKAYSDLVSISNDTQNQEVMQEGKNKTFWIGLLHDEWEWIDKSCSTYRDWVCQRERDCVIQTSRSRLLQQHDCGTPAEVLCSKGYVRIKVIEERLTWEQALDYCTANHTGLLQIQYEEDKEAVEQWLDITNVTGPFWIGLRQSAVFGFWIWRDRKVTDSNWKNGKPPEMPLSNQCGVINSKADNYTWSDENCWLELPFLCEEEILFMDRLD